MTKESGRAADAEPALVCDQAPSGLDPAGFDPARGRCECCEDTGLIDDGPDGPQFCSLCEFGPQAHEAWQYERKQKQTWRVSTNTDVLILGGTIATMEEARRAAAAILSMARSLPDPRAPRDSDQSGEAGQTAEQAGPEGRERGPKASPEPRRTRRP